MDRVLAGGAVVDVFEVEAAHRWHLNDDLIPYLGRASDAEMILEDGMAISIEIATMIPGVGGVRYEDNFIVRGADPLRLSKAEKLVQVDL